MGCLASDFPKVGKSYWRLFFPFLFAEGMYKYCIITVIGDNEKKTRKGYITIGIVSCYDLTLNQKIVPDQLTFF